MSEYAVESVISQEGKTTSKGKPFQKYVLRLAGQDETVEFCDWSNSMMVEDGSKVAGELERSRFGLELKQARSNGQWSGGGKSSGKSFEADPKKLRAENRRSALHAAVSRANAIGPNVTAPDIVKVAEIFYAYIEDGS